MNQKLAKIIRFLSVLPMIIGAIVAAIYGQTQIIASSEEQVLAAYHSRVVVKKIIPTPSLTPTPTPKKIVLVPVITNTAAKPEEWGVAQQVSDYTWTMKVGNDEKMGTPSEILEALNGYRQRHGSSVLSWDQKLAGFAQERANFFNTQGKMDEHAGFRDFMENQDGFNKTGFNALGENSAHLNGGRLAGVHIIEWLFAGDPGHDSNQLNTEWSHVGIGVAGSGIDVVFGGKKQ